MTDDFQVVVAEHTPSAQSAVDAVDVVVPLLPQAARRSAVTAQSRTVATVVRIAMRMPDHETSRLGGLPHPFVGFRGAFGELQLRRAQPPGLDVVAPGEGPFVDESVPL